MNEQYLRLRKLRATDNPVVATPNASNYIPGREHREVSIPVEYTVTGRLYREIEVDKPMFILRDTRNGISIPGLMTTSKVKKIEPKSKGLIIYTDNSVYDLEWIED